MTLMAAQHCMHCLWVTACSTDLHHVQHTVNTVPTLVVTLGVALEVTLVMSMLMVLSHRAAWGGGTTRSATVIEVC